MKQDAPLWLMILCQVGTGMFLAFLNCRFPSGIVACGGFLLIPILSLGVGALLLQTCSLWADFMPVLLVIQGQAFWNHLKTYQKMDVELKKLNAAKEAK
jgi:amino acid transporter